MAKIIKEVKPEEFWDAEGEVAMGGKCSWLELRIDRGKEL